MANKTVFPILIIIILALSACGPTSTTTPPAIPTNATGIPTAVAPTAALPQSTATLIPTATLPAATATLVPSDTPLPVATATVSQGTNPGSANYIDDRSTPSQVIVSFYNAVNRKEYLRAYSYYADPATTLGSYTSFANGYSDTASVDLVFGQITGDPGMSQVYYTIPVILKATSTTNTHTNYAACYVVHEAYSGCLRRSSHFAHEHCPGVGPNIQYECPRCECACLGLQRLSRRRQPAVFCIQQRPQY